MSCKRQRRISYFTWYPKAKSCFHGRIFLRRPSLVFGDGLVHNIEGGRILAGIDLKSMTIEELSRFLAEMGEPKF